MVGSLLIRTGHIAAWALAISLMSGCAGQGQTVPAETAQTVCPQPSPPEEVQCPVCEPWVCPPPTVIEKVVVKPAPAPKRPVVRDLQIVGAVEWVGLEPSGFKLEARIDTGAETSSLHAENIVRFERDGEKWVRFLMRDPLKDDLQEVELPRERGVRIKQLEGELERRNVVRMWVTLGRIRENVEITLTDRSDLEYPVLIGRNFLTDTAVVDVSRHHLMK